MNLTNLSPAGSSNGFIIKLTNLSPAFTLYTRKDLDFNIQVRKCGNINTYIQKKALPKSEGYIILKKKSIEEIFDSFQLITIPITNLLDRLI